jgi:glycosyltransferase involved in cell wall biosynthesis
MIRIRTRRPELSLVLPCYNPKNGWQTQVAGQYKELRKLLPAGTQIEIIVVNDGSPEPVSAAAIKWLGKRIPLFSYHSYAENMGKGYAVRRGVEAAEAEHIIYTDIDFPYTAADIKRVYDLLTEDKAEVVMAIREGYNQKLSLPRRVASTACNYLNKTLLNLPHRDVQSGLKGINQIGKEILLSTSINRFLFDTEFIWLANSYSNIRIKALPVTLRNNISFTSMSSSVYLNEAGNFCRLLLKDKLLLLRRFDAEFKTAIPRIA